MIIEMYNIVLLIDGITFQQLLHWPPGFRILRAVAVL